MRRALAMLVGLAACEERDVGSACPDLQIPVESSNTEQGDVAHAEGSEIIEYNTAFPCNDVICVATLGRGAYCSIECSRDNDCPRAFECRPVTKYGPYAERNYCVWKRCQAAKDCGDPWEVDCTRVPEESLGEVVKLCNRR